MTLCFEFGRYLQLGEYMCEMATGPVGNRKEDDLVRIRREINILSKVQHPNIIQLYEVIETNKYFFFVMEYAMNGELSYYIEKQKR